MKLLMLLVFVVSMGLVNLSLLYASVVNSKLSGVYWIGVFPWLGGFYFGGISIFLSNDVLFDFLNQVLDFFIHQKNVNSINGLY